MGKWDSNLKNLFYAAPEDIVAFLLKDAQFVRLVSPVLTGKEIFCDILCEIRINGKKALLHIEFQKKRNAKMAERLWKYNMDATILYQCPVWSCVIYLTKDSTIAEIFTKDFPDGRIIHRFYYSVIKMWDIPTGELLRTGRSGLAPLLVLTRDGQHTKVVEQAIALLDPPRGKQERELLMLTYGIASLVLLDQADQNWLDRTFGMLYEILKDTHAWQKIAQEVRLEVLQQGGTENLRLAIVDMVEARFADPALTEHVRTQVALINDLAALRHLIVKIALVTTPAEVDPLLMQSAPSAPEQTPKKTTRPRKKKATE